MNSSDITLSILIILIFVGLYFFNILSVGIKQIEEDWNKYKCNPAVMPFAGVFNHDVMQNFTECIQTAQGNYMEYLLHPMSYNLNVFSELANQINTSMLGVKAFLNTLRNSMGDGFRIIFGSFLNIIVEFQELLINFVDSIRKMMGILATLLYTMDGSIKTMTSIWAGPPGQLTRAICFHPNTKVKTKDGNIICMKDLKLNEYLKNGARICSIMKISNKDKNNKQIEKLYKIKNGENNEDILVTGSHLVYDPDIKGFVEVKNLRGKNPAILLDIKCDELSCLITDNHTIPIGDWIFHDWEDNNGSPAKDLV
jgi:hypothetical protein